MEQNKPMSWTLSPEYQPKRNLPDPRIAIARHIGWNKYYNELTEYPTPEPDNYNRAILSLLPVDCKIAEDQVIYKVNEGWITVMLIEDDQINEYETWLKVHSPRAHWQHTTAPKVKARRFI